MPTTTFPITARQQSFIASLAAERTLDEADTAVARQAAEGTLSSRAASLMITQLLDTPSAARPAVRPNRSAAEDIPRPSPNTRAGRMLAAGGIEATVTLPNGEHVTFKITSRRPRGSGWGNCGPTDEGARTSIRVLGSKVGWLNVGQDGQWTATLITRRVEVKDAARALFGYCAGHTDEKGQMGAYRVQESSRCGRCMRTLTDPVSIDRGIGPECLGHTTGSRHVAIVVTANPAVAMQALRDTERSLTAIADALTAPVPRGGGIGNLIRGPREGAIFTFNAPRENTTFAAPLAETPADPNINRARDLIAEALDANCTDADRDFAMRIFDQLITREA
jgi:hypothetical protein